MTAPTPPEAKPSALSESDLGTLKAAEMIAGMGHDAVPFVVNGLCAIIRRLSGEIEARDGRIKELESEVHVERTVKNARTAGFRVQLADANARISEAVEKLREGVCTNAACICLNDPAIIADRLEGKTK